ncbi:MAG: peptidylprolyl isomerase [Chthoniobacteraceae bacterium]
MKLFHLLLFPVLLAVPGRAAAPVIDPPGEVAPRVPIGKALLLPITASDADGDRLTFTVSSDKPGVSVRVRTGHPKLKVSINHVGDGTAADPAFSGTLEFALLRDFTPITAGFIGGFAQGGYFDNQVFHRIADLNPSEDADGSFIMQAGDPLSTNPQTAGTGGPGFSFENELRAPLLFAGRGQLAMANSGFARLTHPTTFQSIETYRATNGSQFFVTDGSPRFLDFNHTIFGQLLRGWDTLDRMSKVPRWPAGTGDPARPQDRPIVDVKIGNSTVEPDFADALLIISATAPVTANITVTASDGTTTVTLPPFAVTAYKDTVNNPPFLRSVPNQTVKTDRTLTVPFKFIDLERDYIFSFNEIVRLAPTYVANGAIKVPGNPVRLAGNAGYVGPLDLGLGVQQYDMTYRGDIDGSPRAIDDRVRVEVAVGDKAMAAKVVSFSAASGVPLANQLVAKFTDTDALGQAGEYTATINWGDGATPGAGTVGRDTSSPLPTAFAVRGGHTYANQGTYPLVVTLTAAKGQRATLRGIAVITAGPLRPFGRTVTTKGAKLSNGIVATFTDDAPLLPAAYSASICWGDGTFSEGLVRRGPGGDFQVLGTHTFPDPEDYSLVVRVRRNGAADAYAWSAAEARGFTRPQHLPPYSTPNLIGQFAPVSLPNGGSKPVLTKTGNQTFGTGQFIAINAGNKATTGGAVRFYLSEDKRLNTTDETVPDPNRPGQTMSNPRDKPLLIGASNLTQVPLNAFVAGGGVRLNFDVNPAGDARLRFPAGENGAGLNVLARFIYSDPLADNLPIERNVVFGPFETFSVGPTVLTVKELGGVAAAAQFKVKLQKQPRANVTIPLVLDTNAQAHVTIDKTSLVFTAADWNVEQAVTVTAKDDGLTGTHTVRVQLTPADASSPGTDVRFDNADPADVFVIVNDKTP